MKFLELNKKRHAVKTFNSKPVEYKDLRTAIEIATLAPSANNIQQHLVLTIFNHGNLSSSKIKKRNLLKIFQV